MSDPIRLPREALPFNEGDRVKCNISNHGEIGTVYQIKHFLSLIDRDGNVQARTPVVCVKFKTHSLEMPATYFEPVADDQTAKTLADFWRNGTN